MDFWHDSFFGGDFLRYFDAPFSMLNVLFLRFVYLSEPQLILVVHRGIPEIWRSYVSTYCYFVLASFDHHPPRYIPYLLHEPCTIEHKYVGKQDGSPSVCKIYADVT